MGERVGTGHVVRVVLGGDPQTGVELQRGDLRPLTV
jgi:hypothetical protein